MRYCSLCCSGWSYSKRSDPESLSLTIQVPVVVYCFYIGCFSVSIHKTIYIETIGDQFCRLVYEPKQYGNSLNVIVTYC